jgi:radical SAM protein with 4Fe4S-binding SPASM domain
VTGRYAVLAPDWLLRGYSDRPAVLYDWRTGEVHTLSAVGGYVARACDGDTDFTSPLFLPTHTATLDLMIEKGMAVECERGTVLDPRQRLRTASNRYLQFANWAVTGRCNLQCRHCYMDAPSARYGELSTEDALRIVDELERANVQRVHLTGGEPLLRGDVWELIAALVERRIGVHQISTNGLLADDAALARLRELDVDPIMHFSYDGVGSHDGMRGVDQVESPSLWAIRRAADAGFRVSVTSSIDRTTGDGVLRSLEVLADAGVHSLHVSAPLGIGCWAGATTALSLAEQAELSEAILRRWLDAGRPFLVTLCGMYGGSPDEYVPPQDPHHRCSPEDLHCGALMNDTVYIMPDARIIPCPRFIDTPIQDAMPSLLEAGLPGAWDDPSVRDLIGVTKAQVLERNPECAACDLFEECGAGCWAVAYKATGDLLGRDPDSCALFKGGYRQRLAGVAAACPSLAR